MTLVQLSTIANAAMVHDLRYININGDPHRSFLCTDGDATILNVGS